MPKVNWGVSARDIDDWDRDSQFKPYDGPIPANGVYQFMVKVLKYVAPTDEKLPQLRIGLELVPRNREEKKYAGYFLMLFRSVSDRSVMFYTPFLDAIGVSGREFERGTIVDEEGNVKKIGRFRNTGDVLIKAELVDEKDQNDNPRKGVRWMGAADEEIEEDDDSDDFDDDDSDDDEDEF